MEIITGAERRRRWRLEEKLRIVAEVEQPGASFADVARRHEVSRGLLWNWRGQVRRGELVQEPMPTFLPMRITADPQAPLPAAIAVAAPAETGVRHRTGRIARFVARIGNMVRQPWLRFARPSCRAEA